MKTILIRPKYLVSLAVLLAVILVTYMVVEWQLQKRQVFGLVRERAEVMMELIRRGSENTVRSNQMVEEVLSDRLLENARYVAELDSLGLLTSFRVGKFARENRLFRVHIFDREGELVLAYPFMPGRPGFGPGPGGGGMGKRILPQLNPLLEGKQREMVLGFRRGGFGPFGGDRYAVAVGRSKGGAVVVIQDAAQMTAFRKGIGIEKMMSDMAAQPDIVYIVLQGIGNNRVVVGEIDSLVAIEADPFLQSVMAGGRKETRVLNNILELADPFVLHDRPVGVFRLGVSMQQMEQLNAQIIRRLLITGGVLLVFGIVAFSLVLVNQNFDLLNRRFEQVKTYQGMVLENMVDAVVAVDGSGKIVVFNRAAEALFVMEVDHLLGTPVFELNGAPFDLIRDSLDRHAAVDEQLVLFERDGVNRTLSVRTTVVFNREGFVDTITALISDLTKQKKLEAQVQRKNQMTAMGELAAGVAHEIRNPLNAVSIVGQRLAQEFEPVSEKEEYRTLLKTLTSELARVGEIIRQFLTFARPPELERRPVSISEFILEVAGIVREEAQEKGIRIEVETPNNGRAVIDVNQMKQALLNLIQNAVQAGRAGGCVRLRALLDGDVLRIYVEDDGAGIPPDQIGRIFNLYFTTKPDGTGMGLALVHRIISEHGGEVEVESEPGKGTRFLLTLPVLREEVSHA